MRILIVSPHFTPETGAVPNRINSMLERFQTSGHEVAVITSKPHHPEGSIWPDYRGKAFEQRTVSGVPVIYAWLFTRTRKTFATRMAAYVSFMVTAVLASLKFRGRFDIILANSPPLFVGISGWLISRIKRGKFVFDVRDLWPDVAVAMGQLRGDTLIYLGEAMERFIYRRADGITAVTRAFTSEIQRKVGRDTPTATIPNGALPIFLENDWSEEVRSRFGITGTFAVLFAGNIGLAQGLAHTIDAAEILQQEDASVRFLFVGSGPAQASLKDEVKKRGLSNISFHDRVPLDEAAIIMASCDALLVPLADDPIYSMFVPSKLFDSMASGRPVLLSVPGIAREILEAAEAGLWYPSENGQALAEIIKDLASKPDESNRLGNNGRTYARQHLMRTTQAERMEEFLLQLAAPQNNAYHH